MNGKTELHTTHFHNQVSEVEDSSQDMITRMIGFSRSATSHSEEDQDSDVTVEVTRDLARSDSGNFWHTSDLP